MWVNARISILVNIDQTETSELVSDQRNETKRNKPGISGCGLFPILTDTFTRRHLCRDLGRPLSIRLSPIYLKKDGSNCSIKFSSSLTTGPNIVVLFYCPRKSPITTQMFVSKRMPDAFKNQQKSNLVAMSLRDLFTKG